MVGSCLKIYTNSENPWIAVAFRESEVQLLCFLVEKLQEATFMLRWDIFVVINACKLPERRFKDLKFKTFYKFREHVDLVKFCESEVQFFCFPVKKLKDVLTLG